MRDPKRLGRTVVGLATLTLIVTAAGAAPATAAKSNVKLVPILSGYQRPLLVTHAGGNNRTIFIVEQGGVISRATFVNGQWKKLGTFLDISSKVNDPAADGNDERGLLGLALHPKYKRNGRFYVFYTRQAAGAANGDAVVAEYRRRTYSRGDATSERIVMVIDEPAGHHNGGHLAFGPDGFLYIGVGDGGAAQVGGGEAQDKGTLLGSILRIAPIDPDGNGPKRYRIPSKNPFVGKAGRGEIWAYGTRNPWRYSFDRRSGDLWVADVGESRREEVNKARSNKWGKGAGKGHDYGWADCEGKLEYNDDEGDADGRCEQHRLPIHDYAIDRETWGSVVGGYVFRGPGARRWKGLYIAGDFYGGVFVLGKKGGRRFSKDSGVQISSFGEDAAGRLFATGIYDGTVYRVKPKGSRP